nr:AAA family ATPase [Candidatus Levybacteria bacterium]
MNLAGRLRPQNLKEFVGQEQLVGKGKIIQRMIQQDQLFPMIFWGPPGSGKTTLAQIIAKETEADFHELSGVTSGKEDLRKIITIARENQQFKRRTILFIDEIHRWNKAQQDVLLPHVESGLLILIGATTENPSFEVISALLSRSRVFVLQSLTTENLKRIIDTALTDTTRGLGEYKRKISEVNKELLTRISGGDARIMLNALEMAVTSYPSASSGRVKKNEITEEMIQDIFQT